jgi:NLI interacting factor-like phosphatase
LKDLIIVDNAVYSFGYQLDNGIPIIPFYDDKSDEELMHLIFYFNCLAQCEDVREQNRKAFQLKDLQEIDIAEYLHSMMNNNNNSAKNGENDGSKNGDEHQIKNEIEPHEEGVHSSGGEDDGSILHDGL